MMQAITRCRICAGTDLGQILDLGEQMLTGVFPRSREMPVTTGPLRLVKCMAAEGCGLVQLAHSYDLGEMYVDNYGYLSGLNASMVRHLHAKVDRLLSLVDVRVGDLIGPGFGSNFVERALKHIYFSATLDAATWGAELAKGEGRGRIYIIGPTGPFEDDPNLTDKKFPGNVTASYRSLEPLRVTGEVEGWVGHSPEQLQAMRDGLARLKAEGIEAID